jgi:Domain of unknown function (DUF3459)
LRLRREEPALHPTSARVEVAHNEAHQWLTLTLASTGSILHAGFNFCPAEQTIALQRAKSGTLLLSTDDPAYGGDGKVRLGSDGLVLPPFSAALMRVA